MVDPFFPYGAYPFIINFYVKFPKKFQHSENIESTWCWGPDLPSIGPRVAGQELVLVWWPGGGPGEPTGGPGLKGPLSRLFSLLWTPGLLLPICGGLKKDSGKFLIFIGIVKFWFWFLLRTSKSCNICSRLSCSELVTRFFKMIFIEKVKKLNKDI